MNSQDDNDNYPAESGQGDQREGSATKPDNDGLFEKLKRWFDIDYNNHGQAEWRREAREDFAFEAGDQLSEEDKDILREMNRPIVVFNRIGVSVDSVAGQEVANRQEVQFLPRQAGGVQVNELLTSAAKWFRQECDAEDEESDAFRDTVVCGMGWTETSLDYEDNPDGAPKIDRTDPMEMVWDSFAKKRNLVDKRRVFHIRRDVPIDEARALIPGDFEDADYNASWVDMGRDDGDKPHENDVNFYTREENNGKGDAADAKTVTLVRAQWWERETGYRMLDPADPTQIKTVSSAERDQIVAKYKMVGAPAPKMVKATRKVYRQAYLGSIVLEVGDAPIPNDFSFHCITGKRNRNKNTFFGIVRAMKDPARWSNKWMSQTMHLMNTNAKGGVAVERGQFFDDDQQGEESWAKSDQVTYLKPGALGANPKMMPKPQGEFPQSSFQLMEFAVQSLPQVSGVNVEALGMQQAADQAAALDRQRKQAVMIILQPLFDGLRRYRKVQGRCLLYLIQHFLSDGRLIKIEGQENAQFVPLIKQADAEYQVIVDEAPTSPNQKELTWTLLQQILPVIGKMLPPQTWLALLKYSPLPTSAQKDISDSIAQAQQQQQQQPNPELQKAQGELAIKQATAQADIQKTHAETAAKVAGMHVEAHTKRAVAVHQAQTDAAVQAMQQQQQAEQDKADAQAKQQQGSDVMAAISQLQQQIQALTATLSKAMAPAPQ